MMRIVKFFQLTLVTVAGAVFWLFACVGIHELGHAFAAMTMTKDDYRVERVQIWPSLEIYPEMKFSPEDATTLGDTHVRMIAKAAPMAQMNTFKEEVALPIDINPPRPTTHVAALPQAESALAPLDPSKLDETRAQADYNVIGLMGSVMTGFVSLIAVVCVICFDLAGFKLFLASVLGLLHLDALLYSLLPTVFGLRHLGLVGGSQPEPIAALSYFGIAPMWSFGVFAVLSFLQLGLLVQHWQKQGDN